MKIMNSVIVLLLIAIAGCNKSNNGNTSTPPVITNNIIKGADVSWLTQMEAGGKKFYDASGTEKDCIQILKDIGMNAVRLRDWVNPSDNWNNTTDVVAKAVRAKNLGM